MGTMPCGYGDAGLRMGRPAAHALRRIRSVRAGGQCS